MNLLSVQDLGHGFGGRTLFKELQFGLEEAEKVALVGANGAGKSTLLQILLGGIAPDTGKVIYRSNTKIAFLQQDPTLPVGLTPYEYLAQKAVGLDPDALYQLAPKLLSQFGFVDAFLEKKTEDLSGGWQKKLCLAGELLLQPDLLILDEPTNHLDIETILWLEQQLLAFPGAVLFVSHDRVFLEKVASRILDLDPRYQNGLLNSKGTFSDYLESKRIFFEGRLQTERTMRNQWRRETEWLQRGAIARQTKQKARGENAFALKGDLDQLINDNRKQVSQLDFTSTTEGRTPKKLLSARGLTIGYPGQILLQDFDFEIRKQSRIALLGPNGSGKSTLIKTLMKKLAPLAGSIDWTEGVQIAYFEQNKETLDFEKSLLANIVDMGDYVHFQGEYLHVRSYLEKFLFFGPKLDLPVKQLSGGEKARLRIAQMMLSNASLLILDEPTNDLDFETLRVLEEALNQFGGAIVLVSHDRAFIESVCDEFFAFPTDGQDQPFTLTRFSSLEQWQSRPRLAKVIASTNQTSSAKRKMSFKERKELEQLPQQLEQLEAELKRLQEWLVSPPPQTTPQRFSEVGQQIHETEKKIETLFTRWQELESKKGEKH